MTIPDSYLEYPQRRYGMDHDRYDWSILPRRPPVTWPDGARVALWVVPAVEWFPLNMKGVPFKPPGAMHHGGLAAADEKQLIDTTLAMLRKASGQAVRGWLSPAKSESAVTPDLLRTAGVDYLCDWVNDDITYAMRTDAGVLHSMPHPIDMDDTAILVQNHHTEDDFRDQLCDQFDLLYSESATQGARIMAMSLHPWVIGQPYRIKALEDALAHIMRHRGVWAATGSEILDAWKAQQV